VLRGGSPRGRWGHSGPRAWADGLARPVQLMCHLASSRGPLRVPRLGCMPQRACSDISARWEQAGWPGLVLGPCMSMGPSCHAVMWMGAPASWWPAGGMVPRNEPTLDGGGSAGGLACRWVELRGNRQALGPCGGFPEVNARPGGCTVISTRRERMGGWGRLLRPPRSLDAAVGRSWRTEGGAPAVIILPAGGVHRRLCAPGTRCATSVAPGAMGHRGRRCAATVAYTGSGWAWGHLGGSPGWMHMPWGVFRCPSASGTTWCADARHRWWWRREQRVCHAACHMQRRQPHWSAQAGPGHVGGHGCTLAALHLAQAMLLSWLAPRSVVFA
jgi:hypothetical protein